MSAPSPPARTWAGELARFLEIQNLGLNLPFALAFLLLAARGLPSLRVLVLVVVAFVAARNAGHSFNRWADRHLDAANPRTRERSLPRGRISAVTALSITAASSVTLLVAAYLLNPLAFVLAPVALGAVLGYSYTKRVTSLTTGVLGFVEGIVPAAVFIAVRGSLPSSVLLAVGGLFAWGTAFEMVHSLGDLDSDRSLGLHSLPLRLGVRRSIAAVAILHGTALVLLALFGLALGLAPPYLGALAGIGAIAAFTDWGLARRPQELRTPFTRHFGMGLVYLVGTLVSLFVPF